MSTLLLNPRRLFYLVISLIGLLVMFHPTILSGFTLMQAEPGDTRLNHYFLEHSFQVLVNRSYPGSLWSPAFFYPFKNALALSDNLFGSAPIYWAFRAVFAQDVAFQLWTFAILWLCFVTFVKVLRRFRVSPILSAFGGLLFAFGMPRTAQIGHHQLFPQFFMPIAFLFIWNFLQKPSPNRLRWSLLFIYLQLLAGVYLGWYFIFSLIIFVPIVLGFDAAIRAQVFQYLRTYWKSTTIAVLIWCALAVSLFLPYLRMSRIIGNRPYEEVASMLPRITSWFLPHPNSIWWGLFASIAERTPAVGEHYLFLGFVAVSLIGIAIYRFRSLTNSLPAEHALLVRACFATCLILFVLSLSVFDHSLWWFIYKIFPGATSMRAMTRIAFVLYFYLLLSTFICINTLFSQTFRQVKLRNAIALILLLLSIPEQLIWLPRQFDRRPVLAIETELRELMRQNCSIAYVSHHPDEPVYSQEMRAMWAGIRTNTPVINGYSGASPPGLAIWKNIELPGLLKWLYDTTQGEIKGNLCVIQSAQSSPISAIANTRTIRSQHYFSTIVPVPPNSPLRSFDQAMRVMIEPPTLLKVNSEIVLPILLRNTGTFTWFRGGKTPVQFSYRWLNQRQEVDPSISERTILPFDLAPNQVAAMNARILAPNRPGRYTLQLTMVQEQVNWFIDRGAKPLNLPIRVTSEP
jgi:hypothetical protein